MDPSNAPSASAPPEPPRAEAHLTAGHFFTRTLEIWRANLLPFAVVSVVLSVPLLVASAAMGWLAARRGGSNFEYGLFAVSDWITALIVLFAALLLVQVGALTRGVALHVTGRPVRVVSMLAAGLGRTGSVLAAFALVAGVLAVLGNLAGLAALALPAVGVAAALAPAVPAASAERLGPWMALRRTWRLTRGHRLSLAVALVGIAVLCAIAIVAGDRGARLLLEGMPRVTIAVTTGIRLVFWPVPLLLPAVAYFELRRAVEGTTDDELVAVFE